MTAIGENNQHRQKLLLKMQRRSPNHPFARVWVLQCQVKTTNDSTPTIRNGDCSCDATFAASLTKIGVFVESSG
jgi:hypothetical protein